MRRARRADIVISNHALVMINAAYAPPVEAETDRRQPTRYVFDEGHHLFDAADSAFQSISAPRNQPSCGPGSAAPRTGAAGRRAG